MGSKQKKLEVGTRVIVKNDPDLGDLAGKEAVITKLSTFLGDIAYVLNGDTSELYLAEDFEDFSPDDSFLVNVTNSGIDFIVKPFSRNILGVEVVEVVKTRIFVEYKAEYVVEDVKETFYLPVRDIVRIQKMK
jgi:hypothetical protein